MEKKILAVFVCLATMFNLGASNLQNTQPIEKPLPIVGETKRSNYFIQPYVGATLVIPAVGVAFRDKNLELEGNIKVSSIGSILTAISVTGSKLIPLAKLPVDGSVYTGVYLGVGGGATLIGTNGGLKAPMPMAFLPPAPTVSAFTGYQGKAGFIDAGIDTVFIPDINEVKVVPVVRCGIKF